MQLASEPDRRPAVRVLVSDVLAGLSRALDITEGHPQGHAARSCLIGMRLADLMRLPDPQRGDLFYALLLKDAGCSSNAARVHQLFGGREQEVKRAVWMRDWRRFPEKAGYALQYAGRGESLMKRALRLLRLAAGTGSEKALFQIRCDRGASIALGLGLSEATASAIRTMDEHWDGGGQPAGLRGDDIPVLGRIIGMAQVFEIFAQERGPAAAFQVLQTRAHRWFDPSMVTAARQLCADTSFWNALAEHDPLELVARAEPTQSAIAADDERLDQIAEAFAQVIDAKSPFTCDHSRRVAGFATQIASRMGFDPTELTRIRRAALLHDIGKLGVPNSILDKPGPLTADEWRVVRRHPAHTWTILEPVPIFTDFALDASCHHEKLDGSGYHAGRKGSELTAAARILAVADICDALLADRPYRAGMAPPDVVRILSEECGRGALCGESVSAAADVLSHVVAPPADSEPAS